MTEEVPQTVETIELTRETAIQTVLGIADHHGGVVKGLAETLKALESQKAKIVFLAEDCDNEQFKNTVRALSQQTGVPVVDVATWVELKDACKLGLPSATIQRIAEEKGKEPKMKPRCSVATIIDWGEDSEARVFLEKELSA
jgi:ribosomal protein L7Ae-like RNA K-turn-binding protein